VSGPVHSEHYANQRDHPAIALYQGWLQVGYATLYTMAPVFSLVLDRDLNEDLALLYPELYKELTKVRHPSLILCNVTPIRLQGRALSFKTFFTWLTISVYQGQRKKHPYNSARN